MKKLIVVLIIIALVGLTVVVASVNPQMHKTFQIERIIIKKGAK